MTVIHPHSMIVIIFIINSSGHGSRKQYQDWIDHDAVRTVHYRTNFYWSQINTACWQVIA